VLLGAFRLPVLLGAFRGGKRSLLGPPLCFRFFGISLAVGLRRV
jgi:hypothetical protein